MERRPIPRVDGRSLGYLRFLREFALPGLPVILTGLGGDWRATTAWRSLASLQGRGLDMSEVVQVQVGQGGVVTLPLAQFFELLRARDTAAASAGGGASADDDPQAPPRQKRRRTSAESAETVPEAGRQEGGHEATPLPPGKLRPPPPTMVSSPQQLATAAAAAAAAASAVLPPPRCRRAWHTPQS